ncbi:uncharacterized protein PV09_07555 [Verruconis gallopava]|uniref:Uncharacterized protein n=1 Tax=Verruconis gallopava TaxID=253628 RepID=A0A0D2A3Q1_9PEZI|nr:uncharacterized protein PV09_07555 [Verruconis gallopava]KIW01040.1 hypothetical protein PV09_07555 [Verruconis gallopava]
MAPKGQRALKLHLEPSKGVPGPASVQGNGRGAFRRRRLRRGIDRFLCASSFPPTRPKTLGLPSKEDKRHVIAPCPQFIAHAPALCFPSFVMVIALCLRLSKPTGPKQRDGWAEHGHIKTSVIAQQQHHYQATAIALNESCPSERKKGKKKKVTVFLSCGPTPRTVTFQSPGTDCFWICWLQKGDDATSHVTAILVPRVSPRSRELGTTTLCLLGKDKSIKGNLLQALFDRPEVRQLVP